MFPLKKTLLVMVSVASMMSGTVATEGYINPGQTLLRERLAQASQPDVSGPSSPGVKKVKNESKPLIPTTKILRKLTSTLRELL